VSDSLSTCTYIGAAAATCAEEERGRTAAGQPASYRERPRLAQWANQFVPVFVRRSEAYPPFKNELSDYVKLQNAPAPKKLRRQFVI
jgi:hypothetical protein